MATLDTSLGWVAGDVSRILLALEIGISNYTINEMTVGCNELGEIDSLQVSNVRTLLSEWDSANTNQKSASSLQNAGKTLVKADVLEWEVQSSQYEGVLQEKRRIYNELRKIFSFVSIINAGNHRMETGLYRS